MVTHSLRLVLRGGVAIAVLAAAMGWGGDADEAFAAEKPVSPPYPPTSHYRQQTLEGWRLRVNKDLLNDHPQLAERVLTQLRHQLYNMKRVVPAAALQQIQGVTIWVELNDPHHRGAVYHPEERWLRENGMNPDKANCVELANARNFVDWSLSQPWMVLHEMAHAYHDQFLPQGYANNDVRATFDQAMSAKRYEKVLKYDGKRVRAYATTNPMEYFAETAEAYFGTNDFYPFVKAELAEHDAAAFELHQRVWNRPAEVGE